jgi:hypothetical protein
MQFMIRNDKIVRLSNDGTSVVVATVVFAPDVRRLLLQANAFDRVQDITDEVLGGIINDRPGAGK